MENEKGLVEMSYDVVDIKRQMDQVHKLMEVTMKENEHYGIIPGTQKKSLYKQGAEKLSMMFRLAPKYTIEKVEMKNGHRETNVSCTIIHIPTQTVVAEGVGSCCTMESKFRYRSGAAFKILKENIPDDAKEKKTEYRKKGFGMKNTDEGWKWVKYGSAEKQENPDIADVYNTVLKMAKKRAHIDAILTATGASDIFTQDYEPGDDDQPPRYLSADEAIKIISSSKDLVELESYCKQYKKDHGEQLTGWDSETWKTVAAAMFAKKEETEKKVADSLKPQTETKPVETTQVEKKQEPDKPDWMQ